MISTLSRIVFQGIKLDHLSLMDKLANLLTKAHPKAYRGIAGGAKRIMLIIKIILIHQEVLSLSFVYTVLLLICIFLVRIQQ